MVQAAAVGREAGQRVVLTQILTHGMSELTGRLRKQDGKAQGVFRRGLWACPGWLEPWCTEQADYGGTH